MRMFRRSMTRIVMNFDSFVDEAGRLRISGDLSFPTELPSAERFRLMTQHRATMTVWLEGSRNKLAEEAEDGQASNG